MWNVSSHLSGLDIAVLLRAGSDAGAGVYGYGPFSGPVAGAGGFVYSCGASAGSVWVLHQELGLDLPWFCLLFLLSL